MNEERITNIESELYQLKVSILSRSSTISYILQKCNWRVTASNIGLILEKPNDNKVFLAYEEYKAAKDLDEIITMLLGRLREELDKDLLSAL